MYKGLCVCGRGLGKVTRNFVISNSSAECMFNMYMHGVWCNQIKN